MRVSHDNISIESIRNYLLFKIVIRVVLNIAHHSELMFISTVKLEHAFVSSELHALYHNLDPECIIQFNFSNSI